MKKLSNKERFDISTMVYFIPSSSKRRIYPNDKSKMALLSSTGKEPGVRTPGFLLLKLGKTYRDEQITSYKRDIRNGLFTKIEILDSTPPRFKEWMWRKIKDVPYDEEAYMESGYECTSQGMSISFSLSGNGMQPLLIKAYREDL